MPPQPTVDQAGDGEHGGSRHTHTGILQGRVGIRKLRIRVRSRDRRSAARGSASRPWRWPGTAARAGAARDHQPIRLARERGREDRVAFRVARQLLRQRDQVLPLERRSIRRLTFIGVHHDRAVRSVIFGNLDTRDLHGRDTRLLAVVRSWRSGSRPCLIVSRAETAVATAPELPDSHVHRRRRAGDAPVLSRRAAHSGDAAGLVRAGRSACSAISWRSSR